MQIHLDDTLKAALSKTCLPLAKSYCANFHNGLCLGINFCPDGRPFRFRRGGCPCLLQLGERCTYFETAVLPMEKRKETDWPKPAFATGEAFRKAAQLYHEAFSETVVIEPQTRKCPDCEKRSVEPRKRCCAECRIRRRKMTDAANHRNWRKEGAQRHTVKEIQSSLGATSRGAISDIRCGLSDPLNFNP